MEHLQYPIGRFFLTKEPDENERKKLISGLQIFPENLLKITCDMTDSQLDTPYRPGGWTVRQVVHHLADSHLNGYVRFKWALTEDQPEIKVYHQDAWAGTPDSLGAPVQISVSLLETLHQRWIHLLKSLNYAQFNRNYIHPQTGKISLSAALALYEWHGRHHAGQIQSLRERNKWI